MRTLLALLAAALLALPAGASADGLDTHGPDPVPPPLKGKARAAAATPLLEWCGSQRLEDDKASEVPNGSHRFHAVYAIPADGTDRFAEYADQIHTNAIDASALIEKSYGRAIRWDMGTDCGPTNLDITVVRLSKSAKALETQAATPRGLLDDVHRDLERVGILAGKRGGDAPTNAVVWLDGPARSSSCGQGDFYADTSRGADNLSEGGGLVSLIFKVEGEFCGSRVVRHEMAHNLGAVQTDAPHSDGTAHCDDAYEDTMCGVGSPSVAGYSGDFFDFGNDDYWDPPSGTPLGWWTVNLSSFICPDAACNGITTVAAAAPTPPPAPPAVEATVVLPRVSMKARRAGRRRWRVTVTATGTGRARVDVRCGRRTVARRRISLPGKLVATVRCGKRPRAAVRT